MKNTTKITALALGFVCAGAVSGQAAVIDAIGGASRIVDTSGGTKVVSQGAAPTILSGADVPGDVNDDAAYNTGIQAFDEVQNFVLANDLNVDNGGTISAGTTVSSHMVFLNSGPGNNKLLIVHGAGGDKENDVSFQFDGEILGVMSDYDGGSEIDSSSFLGADSTVYPTTAFDARGLEGDTPWIPGDKKNDWYSFTDDTISVGFRVTEPGDWIRVITAGTPPGPLAPVPVPASILLLGTALGGFGLMARRRRRAAA